MPKDIKIGWIFLLLVFTFASCAPVESVRKVTFKGPGETPADAPQSIPPSPGETGDIPKDQWGQKKGQPYMVEGETYYPLASAAGFAQSGVASWYGPDFHGKNTANGEVYNQDAGTAAHKTLPFNTFVNVRNMENGKTAVVRINDRGPFKKDRIIDLSKKAAAELGMIGTGTAKVKLTIVGDGHKGQRPYIAGKRMPSKQDREALQ